MRFITRSLSTNGSSSLSRLSGELDQGDVKSTESKQDCFVGIKDDLKSSNQDSRSRLEDSVSKKRF